MRDVPPALASPEWVAAECESREHNLVLADVRWYLDGRSGSEAYEHSHLPGAVFVDLETHLSRHGSPDEGRHPLPTPEAFARSLAALGISPGDHVIAYDDSGGGTAGRLVFMLRSIGRAASLLDGGLRAWPGRLESGAGAPRPALDPAVPVPWPTERLAFYRDVENPDDDSVVIDARSLERYLGAGPAVDARPGHIPTAHSLPWADFIDPETGRFRSPNELRSIFAARGIGPTTDTVCSCGSGVSAGAQLVALEVAGLAPGRLFVPSFSGWSSDNARTVSTKPSPRHH